MGVRRCMAVGRVIAAADVPAFQADAKVKPDTAGGETFDASIHGVGQLRYVDMIEMSAGRHRFLS
jgi:hypothetical protein